MVKIVKIRECRNTYKICVFYRGNCVYITNITEQDLYTASTQLIKTTLATHCKKCVPC